MNKFGLMVLTFVVSVFTTAVVRAEPDGSSKTLTAAQQKEVIAALSTQLKTKYVFPDVAQKVIKQLSAKLAKNGYAKTMGQEAFANVLSDDLREFGNDEHFQVWINPDHPKTDAELNALPSTEQLAADLLVTKRLAYGVQRVEQLRGNIGYIELRGFGPPQMVSEAYTAALSLMQGTDALIIDLRRNGGGEPSSVAYFMSHFFPEGDVRHLNDLYDRVSNTTQQYWTNPSVTLRYNNPVFVLTSERTFSGGEECAYDFQTQKRATLVGERTGGGSNPGGGFALAHDLVAFIPTMRAINPVTKTNWEHVGVTPDIAVPAADALQTAYVAAMKKLLADSKDPEQVEALTELIPMVENNTLPPPNYSKRR